MLTQAERDRILAAVKNEAGKLLAAGIQSISFDVPELGETWTIGRELS